MALIDFDEDVPSFEMVHPAPQGQKSNFAMVCIIGLDTMRLLQFSDDVCEGFESAITSSWPKGIKKRQWVHGTLEFQLHGTPWAGVFAADAVHGRDLVLSIFSHLHSRGWVLVANPLYTVNKNGKDSLIFKKITTTTTTTTTSMDFMALSMPPVGRLRVHAGDQEVIAEIQALMEKFDYFKSAGPVETSWQFKMKGSPWMAGCGDAPHKARRFVLALMETMDRLGWSSYATVRQRDSGDNPKPNTWYFMRPQDWVSGSPFNGDPILKTY